MNSKVNRQGGRDPLSIESCYQATIERENKNRDVILSALLSGRIDLQEVFLYSQAHDPCRVVSGGTL
jgi:hypothetical protein